MNIMVTGGAGYIGSHAVRRLVARGDRVVVLDNLSTGHAEAVPRAGAEMLLEIDVRDTAAVSAALRDHRIQAVLNFAALSCVGESVREPLLYWDNNVGGAVSLLSAMRRAGVQQLVHSSTCAVYGEPAEMPIRETTATCPVSPYGASKLAIEMLLRDTVRAVPEMRVAALRYFNVAGAAEDGSVGEDHHPETHLIPVLLEVAAGLRPEAAVFGDQHATPDGTCLRDYIHVEDLIDAHLFVLDTLRKGEVQSYNLGTGRPHSVFEVIETVREVTGHPIPVRIGPARDGDPPALWADASLIERDLGWSASRTELRDMVADAWAWKRAHPTGYGRHAVRTAAS